ncbi:Caltractin [Symbiodinium sp. CCMP2456]|nr:Caltractin [Symbiodinium sp. CCMP2456]
MLPPGPTVPVVREIDDRASCIVWPAARVLLQWLRTTLKESLDTELEGSTVLELGAGTGFLSLALAQEGVKKVFAAEGDEDAWENLTQNVGTASQLQPVLWNWERDPAIPDEIPLHSLHLIVGSDLVYPGYYNERALAELIRRLVDLMSPAWHVPVILLLCDREPLPPGPRSLESFLGFCDALGLEALELPLSREVLEKALGPLEGRACHEDPGGALGTLSRLRLFHFGRGDKVRGLEPKTVEEAEAMRSCLFDAEMRSCRPLVALPPYLLCSPASASSKLLCALTGLTHGASIQSCVPLELAMLQV